MPTETMRGVYPILVTPFGDDMQVDEQSLRTLVDYQIEGGVHGLGVANGSEVLKLTEAERATVTRVIVEQARGRVPVVINTSGSGTQTVLHYSRMAEENGADALMITPPVAMGMGMGGAASPAGLRAFFAAVSAAVSVPIFIQSAGSMPVSAELAKQIAIECENVRYIKEECRPALSRIANVAKLAGDELIVFGGQGGHHFIREMQRGSVGTMPGCSQPEAFREVWDLFHAGDTEAAYEVHDRILRLLSLTGLFLDGFFHVHKELLRQRGVIKTANVRPPAHPWPDDEMLMGEVQEAMAEYLTWYS